MKLYFTAGVPRSGSTLLQNLLNQNPKIHATSTSGLLGTLRRLRALWREVPEHSAYDPPVSANVRQGAFKGLLTGYWQHNQADFVFDKCRAWPAEIELLEELGFDVKMLVTIRNMREILASWEMVQRRSPLDVKPYANDPNALTLEGRLKIYTAADAPIGSAFNMIKDAIQRGHRDKLHFVSYEELTHNPNNTLSGIYKFFDIPTFEHDFDNIQQTVTENDSVWGLDLHTIENKIKPAKARWFDILGEAGLKYDIDWNKIIS